MRKNCPSNEYISSRHIFGFTQDYAYIDNEAQVFGAQMFGVNLLSRYGSGERVFLTTDLSAILIPLAGIKTVDFATSEEERTYDYAPGAGVRLSAKLLNARGVELASCLNPTARETAALVLPSIGRGRCRMLR